MEWIQLKSCWEKAWDLVLKECVSFKTQFFLWYIAFQHALMYIIYLIFQYSQQCKYTHYTLFLSLYMEAEEEKKNQGSEQNIWSNNPSHGGGSSTDNSSNEE